MLFGRYDGASGPEEWIVIAVLGGVALFASRHSIRDRLIARSADVWPTVVGEVYSTASTGLGNGDYSVTVVYGYRQQGYQSGEFVVPFSSNRDAISFRDRMKDHAKIIVRCDPSDPSRSAILLSDNESDAQ